MPDITDTTAPPATPARLAASRVVPAVVELRQYTLHPGARDTLITLFEREFVETQEAVGIRILGTFRDLDDPDRFVWLRGFPDMPARAESLGAFYGGPAWQNHRDVANPTMIDSDNVLLLRPAGDVHGLLDAAASRPAPDAPDVPDTVVYTMTLCPLRAPADDAVAAAFVQLVRPAWIADGCELLACFVTEGAANTFPRLPVRENDPHIAWLTRFPDADAQRRHAARLASSGALRQPAWRDLLNADAHDVRLAPTRRSALR